MKLNFFRVGIVALLLLVLASPVIAADDKPIELTETTEILMQEVSIIGSKFNIKDIAGSAHFLDVQDIRQHGVDDINRVLRRVPGVNLREEDGFGLFPNISLRGVDSARASKVTVMEDGILQAPAPYSAPSAYYSPTTGRMSGIEVLKGSSQIKFGPHTTGGAINYISTQIPTAEKMYFKASFGSFNEIRNHSYFGGTKQLEGGGKFGYVIELYTRNNNGFKELSPEGIPSIRNEAEANTGFTKHEPMIKLSYEPKSALYQKWEVKFGHTNLDANETYLGLDTATFRASPYGRLAASRFDEIETTQFRTHARHFLEFNPKTSLVTTIYGNTFNRNWQKLNDVGAGNTALSQALAQGVGGAQYEILAGRAAGQFRLRNNNRTYYSYGAQMALKHAAQMGSTEHEFEIGVRWHYDQIRRKQWDETYTQDADGDITAVTTGARGSAGNRLQTTYATAVHAQDQIKFGKFTFTPGLRVEHLNQAYCDDNTSCGSGIEEGTRDYAVVVGGGSLKYDVFDSGGRDFDLFAGIHRGFSPASPRNNIRSGITEETSVGSEIGARYKDALRAFSSEVIVFHTILDDLVVADSVGGVGNGTSVNGGKIQSLGVELQANYDPGLHRGWAFQMPTYVSATLTEATFLETAKSRDAESIFAGANIGNVVPYIPELSLSFGVGAIYKKWSANIDANFVTDAYADASNIGTEANPVTGTADVRFGKIDSRLVMDATLGYQWSDKVRMFSNFKNITSQEYIVSRQPHGPRPGLPFAMMAGLEFDL
ncbi:MAG: TonB-dependent receptor plug domain-containing protein [Nitrospinota bacterium]